MEQATVARVIEELGNLQPDELREVETTVRQLLARTSRDADREAALRVLQESGLVEEIKRPPMVAQQTRPPAPIKGTPLSETIIGERR